MREKLTSAFAPRARARHRATPASIHAFLDETLVVCPKCGGPAGTRRNDPADADWFAPRRLVCRRCTYWRDWARGAIARPWRHGYDDYFRLPLWLRTPCCGEVLWAYNARHLAELEAFVLAQLRERRRDPAQGWSNRAFTSRLPRWIKSAKNRAEVEKALERLRARLAEAG